MTGPNGGYLRANRNARMILFEIIDRLPVQGIIESQELATYLNSLNGSRSYSSRRVGCLLRERIDLTNMRRGKWQKVTV
jgi:NADPH-dependent 7-cyano-7-deazaguanine reductase QueF-like protein